MKTKEERRAYCRAWNERNREKVRAYREANREKIKAWQKAWHIKNREKRRAYSKEYREQYRAKRQARRMLKDYHLTQEQFDLMRQAQNNLCMVCSRLLDRPCVDHDHDTGKVRGLLCRQCNTALGLLQDSSLVAFKAASYLQSHER